MAKRANGQGTCGFDPYRREDPRTAAITNADERLLAAPPAALRILVPTVIDEARPDPADDDPPPAA